MSGRPVRPLVRLVAVLVFGSAHATTVGKKLIHFGWGMPSPAYIAANWQEIERMPFDGVAITLPFTDLDGKTKAFEWSCWTWRAGPWERLRHLAELLRKARWQRMTPNFLRLSSCPGDIDWFNDLSPVVHNARMAARLG